MEDDLKLGHFPLKSCYRIASKNPSENLLQSHSEKPLLRSACCRTTPFRRVSNQIGAGQMRSDRLNWALKRISLSEYALHL